MSAGRLLFLKGFHLGLEAFARAASDDWEYIIIGSGPEEPRLRALGARLGVADRVHFTGWLPRAEVLRLFASADVFCFPSFHDSVGYAVLEAMAARLPVVCLDRSGPALVVDERVGVKVAAHSPRQVVADLAAALRTLAEDPERRRRMGEEARRRVLEEHTWEVRAREIVALYREALEARSQTIRRRG